jgi:hypothetical protein
VNVFFKDRFTLARPNPTLIDAGWRGQLERLSPLVLCHIYVSLIVFPGKLMGNGQVGSVAETRHGCQEFLRRAGLA